MGAEIFGNETKGYSEKSILIMIKAVFFDLDGTLLNSKKEMDDSTKTALKECKKHGIKLFVATARPPILDKMLGWDEKEFGLFDGGLYFNGGCRKIGSKAFYTYIPQNVVSVCINEVSKYNSLNIALQMENEIHAFNNPLADFAYQAWGIDKKAAVEITEECKSKAIKLLIYYENIVDTVTPLPKDLVNNLKQQCNAGAKLYLTDNGRVIQITSKKASKYNGIENIRKQLDLDKSEVAVFGDDTNDLEMLDGYEVSVAMGNADEAVKRTAKFITKSNDDNGIAFALKEILQII